MTNTSAGTPFCAATQAKKQRSNASVSGVANVAQVIVASCHPRTVESV
jgi:hypothetical protein